MTHSEKIFLGTVCGVLQKTEVFENSGIDVNMMSSRNAKQIYQAIKEIIDKGEQPDLLHIYDLNKDIDYKILSEISGMGNISNVNTAIEKIKTAYKVRVINKIGMYGKSCNENNIDETVERINKGFNHLDDTDSGSDIIVVKDSLTKYVEELETRSKNRLVLPGITTGIDQLDSMIFGFQKRKLYCIGARPSEGKSASLVNFCCSAIFDGKRVGYISIESAANEVMGRIISNDAKIDGTRLQRGDLDTKDHIRLLDTCERLYQSVLIIYDKPNAKLDEIKSAARQMIRKYKIDILFVDYLQIITIDRAKNRIESTAQSSMELKQLARQLDIPIVTAAQLNRDADNRKPTLGNFQHSSQIEQDADVAILIYNRKMPDEDQDDYFYEVEKNRDGQTGWIRFIFDKKYMTIKAHPEQCKLDIKRKRYADN